MSERITLREGDSGRIWVFAVDLDEAEARALARRNGTWPVEQALGATGLDPEHVEIFPVSDLGDLGVAGYLEEGYGVPREQLREMRPQLAALRGHVLVLTARAFRGAGRSFAPRAPLRLVASFSEERPPVSFAPLPSEAAVGSVANAARRNAPLRLGRGWVWAVGITAGLLGIVLLVWLAGVLS